MPKQTKNNGDVTPASMLLAAGLNCFDFVFWGTEKGKDSLENLHPKNGIWRYRKLRVLK